MVHEVNVLENVWIMLLELSLSLFIVKLPDHISIKILDFVIKAVPGALGSIYDFTHSIGASVNLAAHAVEMNSVLHLEVNAELVVLVAGNAAVTGSETSCLRNLIS